jgi:FKBP12-rapamycin complex-associated protein
MRCLAALARWDELGALCRETWAPAEPAARLEMAPMAASAAWNLNEWDEMAEYVTVLDDGDDAHRRMPMNAAGGSRGGSVGSGISDGPFFRAVLSVRRGQVRESLGPFEEKAVLVLVTFELLHLCLKSRLLRSTSRDFHVPEARFVFLQSSSLTTCCS